MTVWMATLAGPSGKILAFEPHPDNIIRIENNIQLCRVHDRVQCYQVAVNDGACDKIQLYAGRGHSHSEWNTIGTDADGKPTEVVMEVSAISLDAAIPSHQRVDLVKIDVEGAEFQVLAGMKCLLNKWSPVLVIECHSKQNWKACAALSQQGYDFLICTIAC